MTTSNPTRPREEIEVFGPSPETYAFVALAALPLLAMIGPWRHGYQPTRDLIIAAGVVPLVLYAVRAFKISLSLDGVRYRSPFGRPPLVRWSSITRVRTGAKPFGGFGGGDYPRYFMEIHANELERPVIINVKFFSRAALARLATLLCQRAAHAHLDEATQHLAKGSVPSVFSRGRGKGAS